MSTFISMLAFGYLLGSVSAAIMISKFTKVSDPRDVGSGNPGATNILRYAGKKIAAFTLLGDVLKGYLPVKLSLLLGFSMEQSAAIALIGARFFLSILPISVFIHFMSYNPSSRESTEIILFPISFGHGLPLASGT